jgi:hypothetical protein
LVSHFGLGRPLCLSSEQDSNATTPSQTQFQIPIQSQFRASFLLFNDGQQNVVSFGQEPTTNLQKRPRTEQDSSKELDQQNNLVENRNDPASHQSSTNNTDQNSPIICPVCHHNNVTPLRKKGSLIFWLLFGSIRLTIFSFSFK